MHMRLVILILITLPLINCAGFKPIEKKATIPVGQINPEIDFSKDTPDCETAGERIAASVQEGMALADVQRLVGKPGWRFPGLWLWSASFDRSDRPFVRFGLGAAGNPQAPVLSFGAETSDC